MLVCQNQTCVCKTGLILTGLSTQKCIVEKGFEIVKMSHFLTFFKIWNNFLFEILVNVY